MTLRGKVVKVLRPFKSISVLRSFSGFPKPSVDAKHKHLLLKYLLTYRQKQIEAYSFACKCVLLLQTSPHLLEHIASELERVGMKLISTRRDTHTLEIATIAFQDDMFLCPVLAEAQQDIPLFTSLKGILRGLELLVFDIEKCMATVNLRWAPFVMEMLQYYLDNDYYHDHLNSLHYLFREACIQCLVYLNRKYHVLPSSFFLSNISREGSFPVSGGAYADIWKGYMNGSELICHKVLRIFTASFDEVKLLKDLSKEVLIWRQLRHPYVHEFLGVCADLFRPSFSMVSPWMEHGNITSFLEGKHGGHLGTEFKIRLIHQVAKGIQYLHEHDPPVIHGDVKGANILISGGLQCRITDFGISTMEIDHRFDASDSAIRGSIPWLAPELMNPEPVIILSGKPPFYDKKIDVQVMISVLQGNRPERPSACPEWVYRLAELCWNEKASARPKADFVVLLLSEGITEYWPSPPPLQISHSELPPPTLARARQLPREMALERPPPLKDYGYRHLTRSSSRSLHRRSSSLSQRSSSKSFFEEQSVRRSRSSSSDRSSSLTQRSNRQVSKPVLKILLRKSHPRDDLPATYRESSSPTLRLTGLNIDERDVLRRASTMPIGLSPSIQGLESRFVPPGADKARLAIIERPSSNRGDADNFLLIVDFRELWKDGQLRHVWNNFRQRNQP
uniref:Protein kinase domain-containing protein n=1 Tax=Moniliophthora roreri TaxID=221103 RepID=A0A0W0FF08_MONRR